MTLSESECEVLMMAVPRLRDCEQIKLIMDADFSPNQESNKDELNTYRKNSVLKVLIWSLARIFFAGRNHDEWEPDTVDELELFLKGNLQHMQFGGSYYGKLLPDEKPKTKRLTKKKSGLK